MANDLKDDWPTPDYNPGPHYHIHALGVIALQFASFEASVDILYLNVARRENLPSDLVRLFYFTLNEEKRIEAIKLIFQAYEKDQSVKEAVFNLLEYFHWCRNCRNQLLHAERYPSSLASIGDRQETLHLTKRVSKQSAKSGYLDLTLAELRDIADKMRAGVVQSANIHIFLRFRGRPNTPPAYLAYAGALPKILVVPQTLELALTP